MKPVTIPTEVVESKIYLIPGQKVMIDKDLAELYEVSTKRLKEQVRRNLKRFPKDFMFELTFEEAAMVFSRSQIATLKQGQNIKYLPFAFTQEGIAMLSGVLNSDRAIFVNIAIMRAFVKLRAMLASRKDLAKKLEQLENKYDAQFRAVFDAIRNLMKEDAKPKRGIGFHVR